MIKIGNVGVAGRIEAYTYKLDADGNQVRTGKALTQDNIVTAQGLQVLKGTKDNVLSFKVLSSVISLGTGTQTEQEGVTDLANFARKGTGTRTPVSTVDFDDFEGSGEDLRVRTYRVQHQFAPDGTSRNYSEIGLGEGDTGGLQTYAVFRDSNGNPASITVLADEYFNITYTYQVQAFRLRGFRASTATVLQNSTYALAPKGGRGLPMGPFAVSGAGVQVGTEAWVFTCPRGTVIRDYAGVSYTTDPDFDFEALGALVPTLEGYTASSNTLGDYVYDVLVRQEYASRVATSPMRNIDTQLTAAGLPLTRKNIETSSTGAQVIPPGGISSTDTVYVCMWGSTRRGSIVMLTKPIVVTPDMEFTIDEQVGLAWEVNDPVNKPWIDVDA